MRKEERPAVGGTCAGVLDEQAADAGGEGPEVAGGQEDQNQYRQRRHAEPEHLGGPRRENG